MAGNLKQYVLLGEEYLCDGVSDFVVLFEGTKKQCEQKYIKIAMSTAGSLMYSDFDIVSKKKYERSLDYGE